MTKTFFLEGERITLRQAKDLLGAKNYAAQMKTAKASFLANPLSKIRIHTEQGCLTVWFRAG